MAAWGAIDAREWDEDAASRSPTPPWRRLRTPPAARRPSPHRRRSRSPLVRAHRKPTGSMAPSSSSAHAPPPATNEAKELKLLQQRMDRAAKAREKDIRRAVNAREQKRQDAATIAAQEKDIQRLTTSESQHVQALEAAAQRNVDLEAKNKTLMQRIGHLQLRHFREPTPRNTGLTPCRLGQEKDLEVDPRDL